MAAGSDTVTMAASVGLEGYPTSGRGSLVRLFLVGTYDEPHNVWGTRAEHDPLPSTRPPLPLPVPPPHVL